MGSGIGVSEKLDDIKPCRSSKEELGNCESNREDDVFHMEVCLGKGDNGVVTNDNGVSNNGNGKEVEVEVVGNTISDEGEERMDERESTDATECSSSFGCTDSEGGITEASGDMEVESQLRDDDAMLMGCSDLLRTRKKKVSDEWRKFVRPLMWRCKWAELQIRELQSQAAKYAGKLAECDKRKQYELEKFSTEDHTMKSAPFVDQNQSVKLMKRKKRKRVEETMDLASYTTCHSLFSYFVNKKSGANTAFVHDDHRQAGKTAFEGGEFRDDELLSFQCKDDDDFESILRKIEEAQVHVRQLRMRMDKVVRENAEKFASDYSNYAPHDPSTSCERNSGPSHVINESPLLGSMPTTSQWSSKTLDIPGTAVSISEEVIPPDMIKTIDNPLTGGECKKIANKTIISNRPVKEESNTTDNLQIHLLSEFPHEPEEKPKIVQEVPDPNVSGKIKMPQEQPTITSGPLSKMSFPKNTRKRGRRKARTGRWSKRSSG